MTETQETSAFDLSTVLDDAKKVITNPIEFYRNMPTTGGFAHPLIFAVVMAAICGVLVALFSLIGIGGSSMGGAMAVGIGAIIMFPIFTVIGCFIGAAILFVIWKLMGSEASYETAFRSGAYSTAILPICMLLGIIPYIGVIIRTLWSMFLIYTASVEVAKVKEQTAKIVFGVLAAILVISGINAERAANKWAAKAEQMEKQMENSNFGDVMRKLEEGEEMSAEEAGKAAGEFLKSLEEFGKGLEEATKAEEPAKQDN